MNHSLTPIDNTRGILTKSEQGEGAEYQEDDTEFSEVVINTKQFSRNARLHSAEGVSASVKRSLRLDEDSVDQAVLHTPKKTVQSKLIKNTAPAQPSAKRTSTPRQTSASAASGKSNVVPSKSAPFTKKSCVANSSVASSVQSEGSSFNFTTAAHRRAAMLKKSEEKARTYETTVEEDEWYNREQGAAGRKKKEEAKKKTQKDKELELKEIMMQRNDQMRKMTDGLQQWCRNTEPSGSASNTSNPDQLWADSLVPHLGRMQPEIRDEFMVHVFGMAMRAVRGAWDPQWTDQKNRYVHPKCMVLCVGWLF